VDETHELPPPTLLSALRRAWWLCLILLVIGAAAGYEDAAKKGTAATAQASILVQDPNNPSGTDDRYVNNQVQVLLLPSVSQATAATLSAHGLKITSDEIRQHLGVTPNPNNALITVNYTSPVPRTAQQVANAVVDSYRNLVSGLSQAAAQGQQAQLTNAIAEIDNEIAAAKPGTALTNLQTTRLQLQNQLTQASAAAAGGQSNIIASSPATLPGLARQGNPPLYGAVGGVVGLLAGLAGSYVWLLRRRRFHGSRDPELLLSVPLLSRLPRADKSSRGPGQPDFVWTQGSEASEAAAIALASIVIQSRNANTVALTGATGRSSTTVIAANLAFLAAEQGQRVLVMDGDLRNGQLSEILQPFRRRPAGPSIDPRDLTVAGLVESAVVLDGLELRTLTRSGAGVPPPPSPSACRRLFAHLSEHYDLVIIDVPDLESASSTAMIAAADAVVLVVRDNTSTQRVVQAQERIQLVDATLVGYIYSDQTDRRGGNTPSNLDANHYPAPPPVAGVESQPTLST
jgi:Mrp family chromosome partitioning ATPase/capsular polysaccharide biosynthesis protein